MSTFRNGITATLILITISGFAMLTLVSVTRTPAVQIQPEMHTPEFQKAFFEAASVYGKAGCGDQELAEMTAQNSIRFGVQSKLIAAQVATESNCNSLAVSNRGAVGLMQITPRSFGKKYDFSKINLFNPRQNIETGCDIDQQLIKQYGLRGGLARYYGTGPDGVGLGGDGYAGKVLQLAGKL